MDGQLSLAPGQPASPELDLFHPFLYPPQSPEAKRPPPPRSRPAVGHSAQEHHERDHEQVQPQERVLAGYLQGRE